jgi:syringomycin synthetase protein SyrE
MRAAFETPFNLGSSIPWGMELLRIRDDEHLWFHKYHHIVMDGWGINLVVNEVANAYNRMFAGESAQPQVGESYLREARADIEYLRSPRFERDRVYWTRHFASIPPALYSQSPTPVPGGRSGQQAFSIPRPLLRRLQALAIEHRQGMMHVMLGALAVCLARSQNVQELTIGIPVHNRGTPAAKRTMGMFSSLIPLRLEVPRNCVLTTGTSAFRFRN